MKPVFIEGGQSFDADAATKWIREARNQTNYPVSRKTLCRTRNGHCVLETRIPDREGDWERADIQELDGRLSHGLARPPQAPAPRRPGRTPEIHRPLEP